MKCGPLQIVFVAFFFYFSLSSHGMKCSPLSQNKLLEPPHTKLSGREEDFSLSLSVVYLGPGLHSVCILCMCGCVCAPVWLLVWAERSECARERIKERVKESLKLLQLKPLGVFRVSCKRAKKELQATTQVRNNQIPNISIKRKSLNTWENYRV